MNSSDIMIFFFLEESKSLMIESLLSTRSLLFIGMNSGHLIIYKSTANQVIYTVRAFDQHILHLFPLSSNNASSNQSKATQDRFEQYRFNRFLSTTTKNDPELESSSYMLAIGYGAYPCRSIAQLQNYSSDSIFLQSWSLDDFIL